MRKLDRMQEECLELAHIISKVRRFGMCDYNPNNGVKNSEALFQEIADVQVTIEQVISELNIPEDFLEHCRFKKREKIKEFSSREVKEAP